MLWRTKNITLSVSIRWRARYRCSPEGARTARGILPMTRWCGRFRLSDKGGGLRFGYGSYGPLPGLAAASDGITFQSNNTLVCNGDLTGSAGTVYIISRSGSAMAITMNSSDFSYSMWRWIGKKWVRL